MEQFSKFRTALFNATSREVNAFDQALKAELSRQNETHVSKIQSLHDEVEFLRQQLAKTNQAAQAIQQTQAGIEDTPLPNSRSQLRLSSTITEQEAPQESAEEYPKHPSCDHCCISVEELERHQEQYRLCSAELERVKQAREVMENEAKRWKSRYRQLQATNPGRSIENSQSRTRRREIRPGSAPITQSCTVDPLSGSQDAGATSEPILDPTRSVVHVKRRLAEFSTNQGSPAGFQRNEEKNKDSTITSTQAIIKPSSLNEDSGSIAQDGKLLLSESLQLGSDDPVVVREKTVGRKRKRNNRERPHQSKQIKVEVLSSSPLGQDAKLQTQAVQESMDLDEVPSNIYTPRKLQRRSEPIHNLYSGPGRDEYTTEHWDGPSVEHANEGLNHSIDRTSVPDNERDLTEIHNDAYYRKMGEEYAAQLKAQDESDRVEEIHANQKLHHDRQFVENTEVFAKEPYYVQRQPPGARNGPAGMHVLQPMDTNRILPRTADALRNQPRKTITKERDHGARYIQCLAEDGENTHDGGDGLGYLENRVDLSKAEKSSTGTAFPKDLDANAQRQRLQTLLARPSPEKPSLQTRDFAYEHGVNAPSKALAAVAVNKGQTKPATPRPLNIRKGAPQTSITPRSLPRSSKASNSSGRVSNDATPSTKPKLASRDPSLRSRPLVQLFLNDFKINPNQNQGYDYAFKEVVRKHDQRKCLPGCTRPDCCGTIFRKMAEMGLAKPFHTTRLMASSQEDEEESMLEDYLGDQAHRLRTMSGQERAEVLLQAKTKIFADHFGRHREVYAREPSPVGYWDVDMPSTQEAEELARQAEMRNRQKVEERYREAMRPDGIWKFRDE
ncbi:MAG: hypothetical protein Q9222_001718 [Ikaeria aurantiellina]